MSIPGWLAEKTVALNLAAANRVIDVADTGTGDRSAELVSYLKRLGGKRLRPALLLLGFGARPASDAALQACKAVEYIHLASLYHDDIMDRSHTRRDADSVNARWGNGVAALGGTVLFGQAIDLLFTLGPDYARLGARAAAELCRGQLKESENAFNLDLAVDDHIEILRGKTAALFELAVDLGCLAGSRPADQAVAFRRFAKALGIAFQLQDDLLDWKGDAATMGKAAHTDLNTGIYTLPLIVTLQAERRAASPLRLILEKRNLSAHDVATVVAAVQTDGFAAAEQIKRSWADQARAALADLPDDAVRDDCARLLAAATEREK